MVLGENHILGQIKRAYEAAQTHQTVGDTLSQLMPTVFSVGKAVPTMRILMKMSAPCLLLLNK